MAPQSTRHENEDPFCAPSRCSRLHRAAGFLRRYGSRRPFREHCPIDNRHSLASEKSMPPQSASEKFAQLSDRVHEGLAGDVSCQRVRSRISQAHRSENRKNHRARCFTRRHEPGSLCQAARFLRRMAATLSHRDPGRCRSLPKMPPIGTSSTIKSASVCSNWTTFKAIGITRLSRSS